MNFKEFYKNTIGKLKVGILYGFVIFFVVIWTIFGKYDKQDLWQPLAIGAGVIVFVWIMSWIFRNNK